MLYCLITLAISIIGVVLDIQVAHYFDNTVNSCHFSNGHHKCYCSATKKDFDYVFSGVSGITCDNVATRNPAILEANAAFSVACFLVSCVTLISLLTGFISVTSAEMLNFESPVHQDTTPEWRAEERV